MFLSLSSPLDHSSNKTLTRLGFKFATGSSPEIPRAPEVVAALKKSLTRAGHKANLALQQSAENESLRHVAIEQGWGLDPQDFALATGSPDQKIGGGNEHDVFLHEDSQRVVKITKLGPNRNYGAQGTPLAYLTNLELQNSLFGLGNLVVAARKLAKNEGEEGRGGQKSPPKPRNRH